jgi:2-C-methyl-D-erythritol 4-phosphate cytidylyltransferase
VAAPAAGATAVPENAPLSSPTQVEPVLETVDRRRLRAVQTPQGFERETILRSHQLGAQAAASESSAASDDAGLAEQAGYPVVVVPGDTLSFKITTPIDLALAQVCVSQNLANL